jgi:hypothetical protein
MATSPAKSIALPPELHSAVEQFANIAHRSVDSVAEKILNEYFNPDPEFERIRDLHLAHAAALGLSPDDYHMDKLVMDKLVHEARAERRAESRQTHP